ncbi:MAG: hypothetical protein ACOYKZ_07285 [Chlamydiia bacterium]
MSFNPSITAQLVAVTFDDYIRTSRASGDERCGICEQPDTRHMVQWFSHHGRSAQIL